MSGCVRWEGKSGSAVRWLRLMLGTMLFLIGVALLIARAVAWFKGI